MQNKLKEAIKKQKWTFAKTYEKTAPHEYFIEKENRRLFKLLKEQISLHGQKEFFLLNGKKWQYTYLYLGDYRYWRIEEVMNRTKLENVGTKDGMSYPIVAQNK